VAGRPGKRFYLPGEEEPLLVLTLDRDAHHNARLIHLPVHASWLNQVSTSPSSNARC
jgi:hypothetical protein